MKKIIGYFVSRNFAANSLEEQPSDNILDFLLVHRDTINCFYHLSYNVACILHRLKLSKDQLQNLSDAGELFLEPDYTIYYLSDKYFAIKKGFIWDSPYVQFCDISQYIPWQLEQQEFLGHAVIQKAQEAQLIGKIVLNALHDKVGLHEIENLTSPVRAFEKGYLNRIDLPTVDDVPETAGKYAYMATHGGWFDAYRKGHFEQTWDYDIVAAYSYWTARLMELRYGKWLQTTEYQPNATYGYLFGEITINEQFSPVIYNPGHDGLQRDNQESMNFTPTGTWETYISKQMYEFIYKHSIGTFKVKDSWYWTPDKTVMPLQYTINRLFKAREESTGLDRDVIKRVMVGIWGKLLEVQGDSFGQHFNPVWGEYVETMTKLQVAEVCIQNGIVPLSVAVDGVLTDKQLNVPIGNDMGQWKLSSQGKALVIGTEIVAVEGKEAVKDFSIDYRWLMKQIQQYPHAERYTMSKLSPITLGKALKNDRVDRLGEVEISERAIEIGYDRKRCYPVRPMCGKDLIGNTYQGIAWDISFLKGL